MTELIETIREQRQKIGMLEIAVKKIMTRAEITLAYRATQMATAFLGKSLHHLNAVNPYPESHNANSKAIEPRADLAPFDLFATDEFLALGDTDEVAVIKFLRSKYQVLELELETNLKLVPLGRPLYKLCCEQALLQLYAAKMQLGFVLGLIRDEQKRIDDQISVEPSTPNEETDLPMSGETATEITSFYELIKGFQLSEASDILDLLDDHEDIHPGKLNSMRDDLAIRAIDRFDSLGAEFYSRIKDGKLSDATTVLDKIEDVAPLVSEERSLAVTESLDAMRHTLRTDVDAEIAARKSIHENEKLFYKELDGGDSKSVQSASKLLAESEALLVHIKDEVRKEGAGHQVRRMRETLNALPADTTNDIQDEDFPTAGDGGEVNPEPLKVEADAELTAAITAADPELAEKKDLPFNGGGAAVVPEEKVKELQKAASAKGHVPQTRRAKNAGGKGKGA